MAIEPGDNQMHLNKQSLMIAALALAAVFGIYDTFPLARVMYGSDFNERLMSSASVRSDEMRRVIACDKGQAPDRNACVVHLAADIHSGPTVALAVSLLKTTSAASPPCFDSEEVRATAKGIVTSAQAWIADRTAFDPVDAFYEAHDKSHILVALHGRRAEIGPSNRDARLLQTLETHVANLPLCAPQA